AGDAGRELRPYARRYVAKPAARKRAADTENPRECARSRSVPARVLLHSRPLSFSSLRLSPPRSGTSLLWIHLLSQRGVDSGERRAPFRPLSGTSFRVGTQIRVPEFHPALSRERALLECVVSAREFAVGDAAGEEIFRSGYRVYPDHPRPHLQPGL